MNTDSPVAHRLALQMMRPDGQDRAHPEVASAVAAADRDPDLRAWWENEQSFDRGFAAALSSLKPPAHLHATILVGMRASRRTTVWRRRSLIGLGAAAAVVIAGAVMSGLENDSRKTEASLVEFRTGLIETFESVNKLDHKTADPDEVRSWLARHEGASDLVLPVGLQARATIGCKVLDWRGAKVTLICFRPPTDGDHQAATTHLFVVDESDAPEFLDLKNGTGPVMAQNDPWATAVWSAQGRRYLMISKSPLEQLADVLR